MRGRKAAGAGGRANLQMVNDSKVSPPDRYWMDTERVHPSLARCSAQESPESSFSATKGKEEIRKQQLLLELPPKLWQQI